MGLKHDEGGRLYRWGEDSPVVWLLPMVLVLLLFYLYPTADLLRLSFTDATLISPDYNYTLKTYYQILTDPDIHFTFRITFIFVFANIVLQLMLGLLIALSVNYGVKRQMFMALLTRTAVLMAWVIPGVVVGVIWKMFLSGASYGIINYLAQQIGLGEIPFLYLPNYALASTIISNVWRGTAFSMLLQYAGLQRVPDELYEAADVDGASTLKKFFHITLPLLKPILFINLVLITIYTFNTFDSVIGLTGGGPGRATEVLTLSAYYRVFQYMNLGRGASLAVVLLLINLAMSLVYYRFIRFEESVE